MAHVSPHRWADAARGRLTGGQQRTVEEHAASCPRCAAERARVLGALEVFGDIRRVEAPRLGWDHIGARIYWAVSSERRQGARRGRVLGAGRRGRLAAAGAVAAVAAVAAVWLVAGERRADGVASAPGAHPGAAGRSPGETPATARPAPAAEAALEGLVTFVQGDVTLHGRGEPLAMDEVLVEGARIHTRAGKVAVQFDEASGFTVAESSSVELTAFDHRAVALTVEGEVIVDITRRSPEQSFVVVAGERRIHVRGTSFRVEHRGERTRVACGHGEVAVLGAAEEAAIGAGQVVEWTGGRASAGTLELSQIAQMQREVVRVPAWTGARALRETSATLRVAAAPGRPVEIDGQPVGQGSFSIRLLSGRHHISADDVPGTWVELAPGKTRKARLDAPRHSAPAVGRDERTSELLTALDQSGRLDGCTRALRKQGVLQGAYIILELGVLRGGTIEYLNIAETNLPPATARCVRDAVDGIGFSPGPAVSLRQRITW